MGGLFVMIMWKINVTLYLFAMLLGLLRIVSND